jgi:hypothetical protein
MVLGLVTGISLDAVILRVIFILMNGLKIPFMSSILFSIEVARIAFILLELLHPGHSIPPVDSTGKDRIRHRIAPESDVFRTKLDRIRPGFRRIL